MANSIEVIQAKADDLKSWEPGLPKEFYLFDNLVVSLLLEQKSEFPLAHRARELKTEFETQSKRLTQKYPDIFVDNSRNNLILLVAILRKKELIDNRKLFEAKIDSLILNLFQNKDYHFKYQQILSKDLLIPNAKNIADNYCYAIPRDGFVKEAKEDPDTKKVALDIGEWAQTICAVAPFGVLTSPISHKEMYLGKRSIPFDILSSVLRSPSNAAVSLIKEEDLKKEGGAAIKKYGDYISIVLQKKTEIFGIKSQALAMYGAIFAHAPRYISPANLLPWICNCIVWGGTLAIEIPFKTLAAMMGNLIRAASKPLFDTQASVASKVLSSLATVVVGAIFYLPSQILFSVGNLASYTRNIFDGFANLVSLGFAKLGEIFTKESHVEKYPTAAFSLKTIGASLLSFATGGISFLAGAITTLSNKIAYDGQQKLKKTVQTNLETAQKVLKELEPSSPKDSKAKTTVAKERKAPEIAKTEEKVSEITKTDDKKAEIAVNNTEAVELDNSAPVTIHESSATVARMTAPLEVPLPEKETPLPEKKEMDQIDNWIDTAKKSINEMEKQVEVGNSRILTVYQETQFSTTKKGTGIMLLKELDNSNPTDPRKQTVKTLCDELEKMGSKIQEKLHPSKEKASAAEVEVQPSRSMRNG